MRHGKLIHAARVLAGLSQAGLAERAGVPAEVLRRLEADDALPPSDAATAERLVAALREAGVALLDDDPPGVRLIGPGDGGMKPEDLNASNDG